MKIAIFFLIALYSLPGFAVDAPAIEAAGQVIWVKGQVNATLPQKTKRSLTRKSEIYKEDTVESDKSSTAQISLTDGTLLAIAENTTIQLLNYRYDKKDPTKDSYLMNVTKGGLRTITGEIGKNNPEQTQTKTPVATLSTLGTDYTVIVKPNHDTLIGVKSGKVIAKNLKGKVIELGKFDQRFAMINSANQDIVILNKMPDEFKELNDTKFQNPNLNNKTAAPQGGGNGFCVGQ